MSIMKLKSELAAASSPKSQQTITGEPLPAMMTLDDIMCSEHFPDMNTEESIHTVQGMYNLLEQVEHIENVNLTCNAQVS